MKHLIRTAMLLMLVALLLNFRWVHAATASLLATPCDSNLTSQAQDRVVNLFGSRHSDPVLRCVKEPLLGLDVSYGRTNFAPLLPAIVLIGPNGENVDVLAHEWAHAEISDRIGFLQRNLHLPVWIDEGLAMQVDRRTAYSLAALGDYQAQPNLTVPSPEAISDSGFFVPATQGKLHYSLSRCAVGRWLDGNPDWLNQLTHNLPQAISQLDQQFAACQ